MVFVPFVPASNRPVSPRARELARRLEETIRQFRGEQPGITDPEVRRSLQLVSPGRNPVRRSAMVLIFGGMVLVGFLAAYLAGGGAPAGGPAVTVPIVAVLLGLAIAVGVLRLVRRG